MWPRSLASRDRRACADHHKANTAAVRLQSGWRSDGRPTCHTYETEQRDAWHPPDGNTLQGAHAMDHETGAEGAAAVQAQALTAWAHGRRANASPIGPRRNANRSVTWLMYASSTAAVLAASGEQLGGAVERHRERVGLPVGPCRCRATRVWAAAW